VPDEVAHGTARTAVEAVPHTTVAVAIAVAVAATFEAVGVSGL
jgi:hypothetical protein